MNTLYFKQNIAARIFAAVAMFSLVLGMLPIQAFADQPEGAGPEPKVKICKKNNSDEISFTINNVNISAIGGLADSGLNKDIVPPTPPLYPDGVNWTSTYGGYTGEEIWENNCALPTPPAQEASLTLVKNVSGGSASASSWTLSATGPTNISGVSGTASVTNAKVAPGTYTLSEAGVVADYVNGTTFSCVKNAGEAVSSNSLTLADKDVATCTITNTYAPTAPTTGTIIVDKVTNPASDPQSFEFTTTGTGFSGFSLTDTATPNSQATLAPGTYSVAETAVAGWTQTSATCSDGSPVTAISLQAGETVTCTFTNTKDGAPVVPGCTNPLATNFNKAATPNNPQAADCDFNYESVCTVPANLLINGSFEEPVPTANGGQWEIFSEIIGWTTTNGVEIWNNLLNGPSDGEQNVELDTSAPTTISQSVTTVPGATYELRFDFAARSDSSAESNNSVVAAADTNAVVTASTDNTNWTTYGDTFTATEASTDITFADMGATEGEKALGYGTLIDNAVLCLVSLPDDGGGDDENTYKIEGYVWHDNNRNQEWDGKDDNEEGNEEDSLSGWTIKITNADGDNRTTTTDENGYYSFEVPAGTWTITEELPSRWFHTTAESHVVTVPTEEEETIMETIVSYLVPTAYAAVIETISNKNFGNDRRSGGGGSSNNDNDDDQEGEVLGVSDEADPQGQVLGEQVTAIPAGAPNAGAGGASPFSLGFFQVTPVAFLRRSRIHG